MDTPLIQPHVLDMFDLMCVSNRTCKPPAPLITRLMNKALKPTL